MTKIHATHVMEEIHHADSRHPSLTCTVCGARKDRSHLNVELMQPCPGRSQLSVGLGKLMEDATTKAIRESGIVERLTNPINTSLLAVRETSAAVLDRPDASMIEEKALYEGTIPFETMNLHEKMEVVMQRTADILDRLEAQSRPDERVRIGNGGLRSVLLAIRDDVMFFSNSPARQRIMKRIEQALLEDSQ